MTRSMGSHHSAASITTTWLTPPHVLAALGGWQSFDFDPCAAPDPRPWSTARRMNALTDGDGLVMEWDGRVLLNPPYSTGEIERWLEKLADHGNGTALIFARTETDAQHRFVWQRAAGLLFLRGRLHFHYPDGTRAKANAGAPSVLCAYGQEDMDRLAACELDGAFVPLRFARFVLIEGITGSWAELVREFVQRQRGPVSVSDAYRYFARHPKARTNPHWRAKVRQKLALVGERVGPATYQPRAA